MAACTVGSSSARRACGPPRRPVRARLHRPLDPALVDRAEALLRRIRWDGLVELQFLTGSDGIPHLIDLNGRFYGSLALADPGPTWQLMRERLGPSATYPISMSTDQTTARDRTAA